MFSTPDISIPLPGNYKIEVFFIEINSQEHTRANLLNSNGETVAHALNVGNCPTVCVSQMLDVSLYPHGEADARAASRMAANLVNACQ